MDITRNYFATFLNCCKIYIQKKVIPYMKRMELPFQILIKNFDYILIFEDIFPLLLIRL